MKHVNINISFWQNLWEDLIETFLKDSYGLNLYSPHILIDDIITEIEENQFKSKENKAFFYSKIDEYSKNDIVITSYFKSDFQILRRIFNTNRKGYILETTNQIKRQFKSGLYFDKLIDQIITIVNKEKIEDNFIQTLTYCSQGLIVELLKKSYDIEDIKSFLANIFDKYTIDKENILRTNFPHSVDRELYKNEDGSLNRDTYNNKVISFIKELTTESRIRTLDYYYYKQKEPASYIFVVEGLTGKNRFRIGDVTFYSINEKRYASNVDGEFEKYDFEDLQKNQKERFLQAKVDVDYLLPKSTLNSALNKVESALDILSCYYKPQSGFETNFSNYIIINDKEKIIFTTVSKDKRDIFFKYHDSLKVDCIFSF